MKVQNNGFWEDINNSQKVFGKIKNLERKINSFENIKTNLENLVEMNNLIIGEFDEELSKDLLSQTANFTKLLEKLELETLLSRKI